jgi:hypothetical protein
MLSITTTSACRYSADGMTVPRRVVVVLAHPDDDAMLADLFEDLD